MASAEPATPPGGELIDVDLVYAAAPHQVMQLHLRLPAGATAADALRASGWPAQLGEAVMGTLKLGLWGRLCVFHVSCVRHPRDV